MKKADKYILLGITLLLIVSTFNIYLLKTYFSKPGAIAIITQNGTILHKIQLADIDTPYELDIWASGNQYNRIYVEKNQIRVIGAN